MGQSRFKGRQPSDHWAVPFTAQAGACIHRRELPAGSLADRWRHCGAMSDLRIWWFPMVISGSRYASNRESWSRLGGTNSGSKIWTAPFYKMPLLGSAIHWSLVVQVAGIAKFGVNILVAISSKSAMKWSQYKSLLLFFMFHFSEARWPIFGWVCWEEIWTW